MGRMLGAFDPEDDLDRPDLNKCPDCGCYFATDACPLCGKECPPDMRAGVRAAPKKKRKHTNTGGRVQFIPWYHSWWFILIMTLWMPPVGFVLFLTSPYRTRWKVIFCVVGALYTFFFYFGMGEILLNGCADESYINTDLSEEEYKATCEAVEPEDYYRSGATEGYFTMELTVVRCIASIDVYEAPYYLCRDPRNPSVELLLLDCREGDARRLLSGDRITVWGQACVDGDMAVYDGESEIRITRPGFYMAYVQTSPVTAPAETDTQPATAPAETDTQTAPTTATEGEMMLPRRVGYAI